MDNIDFNKLWQNFVDTVTNHYMDFNGRVGRAQYWFYILVVVLVGLAASIVASFTTHLVSTVVELGLFLPNLGFTVRRLHDTGKPGIWVLLAAVPILATLLLGLAMIGSAMLGFLYFLLALSGVIYLASLVAFGVLIYFCAQPGQAEANQYGPVPPAWTPGKA